MSINKNTKGDFISERLAKSEARTPRLVRALDESASGKTTEALDEKSLREDPRVLEAIRVSPAAHVGWIPTLCDEIERLRSDNDALRAVIGRLGHEVCDHE